MLKANLKIISLLKEFLFTVSTNPVYRNQFSTSSTSFTRRRKLTFEILSFFIVNLNKRTLSVELEKYFEQIDGKTKCSVAAFTMQRLKLLPEFFYSWNKVLCASFYSEYKKKVKRWKGFKILACDGSSVSLINRPALQEYFGGQSNPHKYFVLAKTFYCYDVLNKLILHSAINPYKYSEFRMACDLIDSGKLKKDMLLIFDRLYSAYNIVALLNYNEADVKFIIRVNENYNYAKEFIASKKKSAVIELSSTKNSRNQLMSRGYFVSPNSTIKVRLIRIDLPEGKVEVLMTNLWKEEGHRSSEFKYLYSLRWRVETNIDFQKNVLKLEAMSGLTPQTVKQDFYATVFTTNLYFLLIKDAQETLDENNTGKKYPMQVNNNRASGKMKELLVPLFLEQEPIKILMKLHDYFIRSPLPVRKNRSFPRVIKNPQSKSKHKTFSNYKPAY